MIEPPTPSNEAERLAALMRLGILDSPREPVFDRIVSEAAAMAKAPISLISFVTDSRQWFKASIGMSTKETNRNAAFCAWAIYNADVFCVEDASTDARFEENALVVGDPHIRAYAGVPIESPDGFLLGTLCVIDDKPRKFERDVLDQLSALAAKVSGLLATWKGGATEAPNET